MHCSCLKQALHTGRLERLLDSDCRACDAGRFFLFGIHVGFPRAFTIFIFIEIRGVHRNFPYINVSTQCRIIVVGRLFISRISSVLPMDQLRDMIIVQ